MPTTPAQEHRFRQLTAEHAAVSRQELELGLPPGPFLLLVARETLDAPPAAVELVGDDGKPAELELALGAIAGERARSHREAERLEDALVGLLHLNGRRGITAAAERAELSRQHLYNRLARLDEAPAA